MYSYAEHVIHPPEDISEPEIPCWDCIDGSLGSCMSKFDDSTLTNMLKNLEETKLKMLSGKKHHAPYLNNFDAKMNYINERLGNEKITGVTNSFTC